MGLGTVLVVRILLSWALHSFAPYHLSSHGELARGLNGQLLGSRRKGVQPL